MNDEPQNNTEPNNFNNQIPTEGNAPENLPFDLNNLPITENENRMNDLSGEMNSLQNDHQVYQKEIEKPREEVKPDMILEENPKQSPPKLTKIIIPILVILILAFLLNYGLKFMNDMTKPSSGKVLEISAGENNFIVEVADSAGSRILGLSGRRNEPFGTGLLMIFDKSDKHGIWMKDMEFSIDVLWINEDFEIVDIVENMLPETFPEVFYPKTDSLYVIEFPAGSVEKYSLALRQKFDFNANSDIAK